MTSIDQRDRIARALSEADISGPDDFDTADEMERRMYDRMALAAINNQYLYAIHTASEPKVFYALANIVGEISITRYEDDFEVWGEPAGPRDTRHLVIATSDDWVARNVLRALEGVGVAPVLTEHADWSVVLDRI